MVKLYANELRVKAKVRDLDTGRDVRGVIWVDEEAGEAEAYHHGADGKKVLIYDHDGAAAWQTVLLRGRFKLVPVDPPPLPNFSRLIGAPACARCRSPLTLRGDDLCPRCKAADRGRPLKVEQCGPFDLHKCERCSRDATWAVVDEVEVTPQRGEVATAVTIPNGAYLFDRRATVGRRYFCAWHFQGPRLVDSKGEVIETDEGGPRPDK